MKKTAKGAYLAKMFLKSLNKAITEENKQMRPETRKKMCEIEKKELKRLKGG